MKLALLLATALVIPPDCVQQPFCRASVCATSITADSAQPPEFPCPRSGNNQNDVDVFSWNEFIAWNWPAAGTGCTVDKTKSILGVKGGANGPVVWQTQMETKDLFAKQPAAFCAAPGLHAMQRVGKADPTAIVMDRSGRWLRYEKLVNETEYLYIRDNHLWTKASVEGIGIQFPLLSTEFEAAWKVLTPAEVAGRRYYTTVATVFNTPDGAPSAGKNPVTLGLVGLAIAHKGPNGFFWSTFEHVDNEKVLASGTQPPPFLELDPKTRKPRAPGAPLYRVTPPAASSAINAHYQKLLAGSVFANYRLIGTQWQFDLNTGGAPVHLANLAMEPYAQSLETEDPKYPKGQKFTGCLACHGLSKWDQSLVFLDAK